MRFSWTALLAILLLAVVMDAQTPVKSDSIVSNSRIADGVEFRLHHGTLRVQFCSDSLAHVTFRAASSAEHPQPWIVKTEWPAVPFTVTEDANKNTIIATKRLRIVAEHNSAALVFEDMAGNLLVREAASPRPRELTPIAGDAEKSFRADAYFDLTQDEAIYGLGQHQTGLLNQRGTDLLLMQDNTNISIPFLLSSRGYGLLWNSASLGHYENHFQPKLALRADADDAVDYYFIYGPEFDRIIAAYRTLTGPAPMLPRWAYGFWQSRLQYNSQQEMLDVAEKYRELKIPLDNLVLDFGWMVRMGSHQFTADFPDPAAMFSKLREMHVHTMISVWPLYTPPSGNFDEMLAHNFFVTGGRTQVPSYYPGSRLFDAFNANARKTFWQQMKTGLYDKGVEAWWLDSSEPLDFYGEEQGPMLEGAQTALGRGTRYANMYPLMETQAVYDGQRATTDKQRVFILTRSAFLGQQRHAATSWSGDIAPTFDSLRRQIPAGLNYSMSGLPYWTTDIGGFQGGDPNDPAYQEVYVRWFEYGTFCPIFRTHGARKANELWSYGPRAQEILTSYDKLRYRLMPYIYSLAWKVTSEGYTPMRALVMDFPGDRSALDVPDQFLFGPAFLVNPVATAGATSRSVYLPSGAIWYDFWTGASLSGGETVRAAAPLETMPLYIRAGSIVPMDPELQYTSEKPADLIELRIYRGADGRFTLYEDDGESYGYERGEHATISFTWTDASQTLSIGARSGSFPGMVRERTFNIVLVGKGHGVGEAPVVSADRVVRYNGEAISVNFKSTR
ncbi:MAG TPA: glycoside hydrolase family 31 protein [Candidatus Limnocylindrales bacterium]|jgi:alpha-D-xyloside xylohydrolase|nr:glycoside hydrolase family 31 protein [Candidatus Limnocylindrales bacterium]